MDDVGRAARGTAMAERDFGNRLIAARTRRDYTQSKLAQIAEIDQTQVAHYESGQRGPSADNLRKLALALDVSADFLLGLIDDTRRIK